METLIALPLLITLLGSLMLSLYFLLSILWAEHWVYRANICLIEGKYRWQCKNKLEEKLNAVLSNDFYQITDFWKTTQHSRVRLLLKTPGFQSSVLKVIQTDIDLPLRSQSLLMHEGFQ